MTQCATIISGTLQSTPIPWLPVLSHIRPSYLRREDAISNLRNKVEFSDHLPLFSDVTDHPTFDISHIVDSCPLTKLDGGVQSLNPADKAAVNWLTSDGT